MNPFGDKQLLREKFNFLTLVYINNQLKNYANASKNTQYITPKFLTNA